MKHLIESTKSAEEISLNYLKESSKDISKIIELKAGKNKIKLTFSFSSGSGNWSLIRSTDKGVLMGGYYYEGKVGFDSIDKSLFYFEKELKELIKSLLSK